MPPTKLPSFLSALFGRNGPECGYRAGASRSTKRLAFCYHLVVTRLAASIFRQRFPEREVEQIAHGFRVIYHFPCQDVVVAERVNSAGCSGASWKVGDCFADAADMVRQLCNVIDEPEGLEVYSKLAHVDKDAALQAMALVKRLRHRQLQVLRDGIELSLVYFRQPGEEHSPIPAFLISVP